ncbi:MAG: methyltransferase domain-containing protein [Bacteroidota bacterium]
MKINLPEDLFKRQDESPDEEFYAMPRLVTHIDKHAIDAVTKLYRELLPPDGVILDLMSSWISHLPEDVNYQEVIGLGMNEAELKANKRLTSYDIQNLNTHPILPYEDNQFDGATICVSVDYLIKPVEVIQEVGRVLKKDAPLIITFSNRCFPTKVIAIWLQLKDRERVALVKQFMELAECFDPIHTLNRSPKRGRDPLYAVVGIKNQ